MMSEHIHQNQPVLTAGVSLTEAHVAVILLHGRGGTAQDILSLTSHLPQGKIAYLAPQAAQQTWYPNSGFIPIEANEPFVSSAFHKIDDLLTQIVDAGLARNTVVLGGFSQGACLAAEFVARHTQRYGGLFILSGALMGPPDAPRRYAGSLEGTPVYIAGSEHDPWVTGEQLRLTAQVLQQLEATVQIEIQPGTTHSIRQAEIDQVNEMITQVSRTMQSGLLPGS